MNITRYATDTAFKLQAAATISKGQLVGVDANGKAVLADADAATPIKAIGFALSDVVSGDMLGIALSGEIEVPGGTMNEAAVLYLSDTAGAVTETAPSTATDVVQPVGFVISPTRYILNITAAFGTVQAAGTTTKVFA